MFLYIFVKNNNLESYMRTVKLITCYKLFQTRVIKGTPENEGITMLSASPPGTEHWEYVCKDCGKAFDKPVGKILSLNFMTNI